MTVVLWRMVAALLVVPVVLVIWWPAIAVQYPAEEQDAAMAAFLFRVFVIVLAIVVFARLRANPHLTEWLPGFLVFPLAALFNPFDVMRGFSIGVFCPAAGCDGANWREIVGIFYALLSPLLVVEFIAFGLLFILVRIAAGKMWPGRAGG